MVSKIPDFKFKILKKENSKNACGVRGGGDKFPLELLFKLK